MDDYTPGKRTGIDSASKGRSKVSDAQRRKIAAAKIVGETHRAIAAETGLAVTTVDHAVTDPRVSTLTLRLKGRDEARLEQAWDLTVGSILKDLKSKSPAVVIAARRDLMRLLPLGDPPLLRVSPQDTSKGDFTLEQLLAAYLSA